MEMTSDELLKGIEKFKQDGSAEDFRQLFMMTHKVIHQLAGERNVAQRELVKAHEALYQTGLASGAYMRMQADTIANLAEEVRSLKEEARALQECL